MQLITYWYAQTVKSFLQDVIKQNNKHKTVQEQQTIDIVSMNVISLLLRYISILCVYSCYDK